MKCKDKFIVPAGQGVSKKVTGKYGGYGYRRGTDNKLQIIKQKRWTRKKLKISR